MTDPDGNPVFCGGTINRDTDKNCFVYQNGTWADAPYNMTQRHSIGRSVRLDDGRYWILGSFLR